MNLIQIFTHYSDQEACTKHLEDVRWGDTPHCSHCGSDYVVRKADSERVGWWNCHAGFNVVQEFLPRLTPDHQPRRTVRDSIIHANTIEGVCALLKRVWYGSHHYTKCFTPLFVAETVWQYNHRANANAFGAFRQMVVA